jgi:uncharacterized protein (DUF1330 family)
MLTDVERKSGGRIIVRADNALQVEGEDKPALIAQTLVMILA